MSIFLAFLIIFFQCVDCFAGEKYNSTTGSKDYCVTVRNQSGSVTNDKCLELRIPNGQLTNQGTYFLLSAGSAVGGYTSMSTADSVVSTSYSLVKKAIAGIAGFDTGTLGNGRSGQILTILITEVPSGYSWTLTPSRKTGFTALVFEAVGDQVTLLYVDDTVGWILISRESVQNN